MSDESTINYCDSVGSCIAPLFDDEKLCRYSKVMGCYRAGGCILRTWFAGCMSQEARAAAKETGRMARKVIDAATKEEGTKS
jgi:hypothetical protein